jgi:hypothetical protein
MTHMKKTSSAVLCASLALSFTGSSLPQHLKTVEVTLFANQSLEPNVAEEITLALSGEIVSGNLLKVVQSDGDAAIGGTVTSYANTPYTYGASDTRKVSVQQYVVRITAQVEFFDNKKDEAVFKGTVTGECVYDLQGGTEQEAKKAAIKELVQRIMENSVQGW